MRSGTTNKCDIYEVIIMEAEFNTTQKVMLAFVIVITLLAVGALTHMDISSNNICTQERRTWCHEETGWEKAEKQLKAMKWKSG